MAIFYFLLDSLVFVTQGVRALDACSSWLCSSAEETSCVGWWEKDLLDWSAWTRLPLPPHWAGRVKLLLTGFAKWVSPHGWATMAGRSASRQFPTQEPSMAPGC